MRKLIKAIQVRAKNGPRKCRCCGCPLGDTQEICPRCGASNV